MNSFEIVLDGVVEMAEGYEVELIRRESESGQMALRARNEGGNAETLIDFWGLIGWMRFGPESGRVSSGFVLPTDKGCGLST